jgi:hypothetical protein
MFLFRPSSSVGATEAKQPAAMIMHGAPSTSIIDSWPPLPGYCDPNDQMIFFEKSNAIKSKQTQKTH